MAWAWVKLVSGLLLLIVGAESLVRGASQLAAVFRVSSLVIGLTIVSFGTSAPELAVSIQSVLSGRTDICLGSVVGSNIFNVILILGISALIVPLAVDRAMVRRDVPVMILASLLVLGFGWDGLVSRGEGAVLFAGLVLYALWCLRRARSAERETSVADSPAIPGPGRTVPVLLILVGLGLLTGGSRWLVGGAVTLAQGWGVSELLIGLTIVAAGTSMPEAVTSVVAAYRGERDIAVGNVVGSNIFNILGVLGLSCVLSSRGVESTPALRFDIPVMIAVALACLPIFITGGRITRLEGALFLASYVAYTVVLVLDATGVEIGPWRWLAIGSFVLPFLVIGLEAMGLRRQRARGSSSASG